jgi:hypothetical protein
MIDNCIFIKKIFKKPVPFHGFLETLLVLWKKIFFTKRCAFQSSTRIYKTYSRHFENKPIIEKKDEKSHKK